jgi:hypothetical protein
MSGNTPLHYAAWFLRHSDAVSYLLKHGADVNIRNLYQETPLHSVANCPYWSDTAHDGQTPTKKETAEELFKDQEAMMVELMEAGGIEMMDQPNHAGKSPRPIIQGWKEHAREAQAKQTAINNDVPWCD